MPVYAPSESVVAFVAGVDTIARRVAAHNAVATAEPKVAKRANALWIRPALLGPYPFGAAVAHFVAGAKLLRGPDADPAIAAEQFKLGLWHAESDRTDVKVVAAIVAQHPPSPFFFTGTSLIPSELDANALPYHLSLPDRYWRLNPVGHDFRDTDESVVCSFAAVAPLLSELDTVAALRDRNFHISAEGIPEILDRNGIERPSRHGLTIPPEAQRKVIALRDSGLSYTEIEGALKNHENPRFRIGKSSAQRIYAAEMRRRKTLAAQTAEDGAS